MRTIRNITFVILCALMYLEPTSITANSSCYANYDYTDISGADHYSGDCDDCNGDAYNNAINHCWSYSYTMVEYHCNTHDYRYACAPLIYD